ncbi:uncharacterized protein BDZ99DRAFT_450637 [Mytilinidion resinicola]|uniref:Rhodopsin domain-containing protein n=1 Tax=Mytilinidion resinicola TaxID=574789 RepID=A0A6A6Y8E2_9PEZI|nr:uncharacterized protein BDZ99DRAFT_450637 [Mytilinidion resinicola]KAF2805106.1 hypothetical protein BDZ99DRAFT_450637 [Mytilinidion resinicola]
MSHSLSSDPNTYPPGYLEEYSGQGLIAASVAFIVLEVLVAGLRLYARRMKEPGRGLDDWFIWPALFVNVATCIEGVVLIPLAGVGRHLAANYIYHPEKLEAWRKGIFACVWLWALAVCLPKLSILGFYLRFFQRRVERMVTYSLMFIVGATFIATGVATTFQCSPVAFQWDKTIPNGRCFNVLAFYRWMSFPNILTDAVILVLPLPMIWRLHTSTNTKIGIMMMFMTGSVGLISSCLRFVIFFRHNAFQDNTWTSVSLLTWTDIEPGIYFIAACMPSLRPVFLRIRHFLVFPRKSKTITSDPAVDGSRTLNMELATMSFSKGNKRSGFERLVTAEASSEEGREHGQFKGRGTIPSGNIGVTKNITIEHDIA